MNYIRVADNSKYYKPDSDGVTIAEKMVEKAVWAIDIVDNPDKPITPSNTTRYRALQRLLPLDTDLFRTVLVLHDQKKKKWWIGRLKCDEAGQYREQGHVDPVLHPEWAASLGPRNTFFNSEDLLQMREDGNDVGGQNEILFRVDWTPMGQRTEAEWEWMKSGGQNYPTLKRLTGSIPDRLMAAEALLSLQN